MPVTISAASATSVGRVRSLNEDSVLVSRCIFAVADGMGGHAAGDRASQLAIAALSTQGDAEVIDPDALHQAIARANSDIWSEGSRLAEEAGMGTTLTGLAVVRMGGSPHWMAFNIGDSRVYAVEDGVLHQVTVDHSEVQELVDAGQITPDEARHHPLRHVVTRSLGTHPAPATDVWLLPLEPSQVFVVCSDGLTSELEDDVIRDLVDVPGQDASSCATRLVEAADAAGGRDNTTVIVVRTESGDTAGEDTQPRGIVLEGLQ